MLRQEKQVRSIWVSHREAEQPFPDAPELQGILDRSTSYSVRALSKPVQDGVLRVSFSYETTREDIDALTRGLQAAQKQLFTSLS